MSADLVEFTLTLQQQPKTKTLELTQRLELEATWPVERFELAIRQLRRFDPVER